MIDERSDGTEHSHGQRSALLEGDGQDRNRWRGIARYPAAPAGDDPQQAGVRQDRAQGPGGTLIGETTRGSHDGYRSRTAAVTLAPTMATLWERCAPRCGMSRALERRRRRMLDPMTAVSPYIMDPRVDAYIDALPDWQREIFSRVRDLVHEADPEVEETIKRTVQPYFVLDGNICAFLAAKDHVNVFLYDPIVPDPEGIITAGHDNKTGRQRATARASRSTSGRSWRCSRRSSRTTGPAAGASSRPRRGICPSYAPIRSLGSPATPSRDPVDGRVAPSQTIRRAFRIASTAGVCWRVGWSPVSAWLSHTPSMALAIAVARSRTSHGGRTSSENRSSAGTIP